MTSLSLRPAKKDDASDMAVLADMAGHGLPAWIWASGGDKEFTSALEAGRARALRETGAFSWRNAQIAELDGRVAGLLVGYRQPDIAEAADLDELPAPIRPIVDLEAQAPGTWYVNMIAVFSECRRFGVGRMLMHEAQSRATASAATGLSLIVEDTNAAAAAFYDRIGFKQADTRPYIPFPGGPDASRWVLMIKSLQAGRTPHG